MEELTELVAPRTAASERCEAICGLLTLPEGGQVHVEGWHQLALRALHAPRRVELLALVPKGNGKTTIFGGAGIDHLLTEPNAQCFLAASDTEQAKEMYRFMSHFAECDEEIAEWLDVKIGTNEIRCVRDRGFAKVLASDSSKSGGKKQAFNPTLFFCDELHAHENPNLYVAGRSAVFKRRGRMATMTTAGHDPKSVLGQRRKRILDQAEECGQVWTDLHVTDDGRLSDVGPGRLTVAITPTGNTVLLEWACRDEDHPEGADDLDDSAVVKLANPASFVTESSIDDAREALEPWVFARWRANVWTVAAKIWIPRGSWPKLKNPAAVIPPGAPVVGFIDMARYRDTAALVIRWDPVGRKAVLKAHWISDQGTPEEPIEYEAAKQAIREVRALYRLLQCGFDPKYFDQSATELRLEGVPMVLFPQSNDRMCPASSDFRQEILTGAFEHDGNPVLARHVRAGVAVDVGETEWKLTKKSDNGPPIDALIASVCVSAIARQPVYTGPLMEVIGD